MTAQITSLQNPRVKDLVRLRERKHRDRSRTFLLEGFRELTRAVNAGVAITEVYFSPGLFLGENENELLGRVSAPGIEPIEVSEAVFGKISYRDRPEGLLAVAEQFSTALDRLPVDENGFILVVEGIEKPGNLGTMLRTADAAGVDAVIVCDPATDPFNPNVVRASLGTLFTVPLGIGSTPQAIEFLHRRGIVTVATTPAGESPIWEADFPSRGVAMVVGSEQYGLGETWLTGARHRVRLPMAGSADSLNAAMAAGIALFEVVRRRHGETG